jgi:hypothetical protein
MVYGFSQGQVQVGLGIPPGLPVVLSSCCCCQWSKRPVQQELLKNSRDHSPASEVMGCFSLQNNNDVVIIIRFLSLSSVIWHYPLVLVAESRGSVIEV